MKLNLTENEVAMICGALAEQALVADRTGSALALTDSKAHAADLRALRQKIAAVAERHAQITEDIRTL